MHQLTKGFFSKAAKKRKQIAPRCRRFKKPQQGQHKGANNKGAARGNAANPMALVGLGCFRGLHMGAQWLTPKRAFVTHSTCEVVVHTRKLEVVVGVVCTSVPSASRNTHQLETMDPPSWPNTLEVSLRILFIQNVAPTQAWACDLLLR